MMITKRKFHFMLLGVLFVSLFFSMEVKAAEVFPDIQGNWAAQTIQSLAAKGILNGYPDGTFKPNQTVTRAELAKMISKTFNYQTAAGSNLSDISQHWAYSYISTLTSDKVMSSYTDGTFKPENPVSRAKVANIMATILHVATLEEQFTDKWPASFTDVSANYWGFHYIEIANKLKVLPPDYKTEFHPDQHGLL